MLVVKITLTHDITWP